MEEPTLEVLAAALKKHDWYYMMSDDPRVNDKGRESSRQLKALVAQLGDEGEKMYKAARTEAWS